MNNLANFFGQFCTNSDEAPRTEIWEHRLVEPAKLVARDNLDGADGGPAQRDWEEGVLEERRDEMVEEEEQERCLAGGGDRGGSMTTEEGARGGQRRM